VDGRITQSWTGEEALLDSAAHDIPCPREAVTRLAGNGLHAVIHGCAVLVTYDRTAAVGADYAWILTARVADSPSR
jgi:hypothetical protein